MNLDKIISLCAAEGSNLSKLERECGFANATIRKWDTNSPGADNLKKVADHFGVSVDYLMGREEYDLSDDARECARMYDVLPDEKKQLVKIYISVIAAQ